MLSFHSQMTDHENRLQRLETDVRDGARRLHAPLALQERMETAVNRMRAVYPECEEGENVLPPQRGWTAQFLTAIWRFVLPIMGRKTPDHDPDEPSLPFAETPESVPHDETLRQAWLQRLNELESEIQALDEAKPEWGSVVTALRQEASDYEARLKRAREFRIVVEPTPTRSPGRSLWRRLLDVIRTRSLSPLRNRRRAQIPVRSSNAVTLKEACDRRLPDITAEHRKIEAESQSLAGEWQMLLDELETMEQRVWP